MNPELPTIQAPLLDIRILLVDDSDDNRFLLNRILSNKGAIITEARNGKIAVDKALSEKFDIVLMDVEMPVMDGLEATIELRSQGFTAPIIALTGHAMAEERDRCLSAGATVHATKPVDFQQLTATILKLVKK